MVRISASYLYKNQGFPQRICKSPAVSWPCGTCRYLCGQGNRYLRHQLQRFKGWNPPPRRSMHVSPVFFIHWKFYLRKLHKRRLVDNYGSRGCGKNRRKPSPQLTIHNIHIFWNFFLLESVDILFLLSFPCFFLSFRFYKPFPFPYSISPNLSTFSTFSTNKAHILPPLFFRENYYLHLIFVVI